MTDSATWWRADTHLRTEVTASRIPALASCAGLFVAFVLAGLSGCGKPENTQSSADAISPGAPVAELSPPQPSASATGLIPLPTREQVLSSVPEGRVDPFAPIIVRSTALTDQIDSDVADTPYFDVIGVLAVGAELRALVRGPEISGTVCVGQGGRCPGNPAPLPKDWTVNDIDLARGCLSFSISGESQAPRCIT